MEGPPRAAPSSPSGTLGGEPALSSPDQFPDQLRSPGRKAESGSLRALVLSIVSHLFNASEKQEVHVTLSPSLFISVAESEKSFLDF